jgi:ankyrin repeat protein
MVGKIPKKKKRAGMDEYGRTPLHYVREESEARKLIQSGLNMDHQDDNEWTPLHFAAQDGKLEVARTLIDSGANINITDINGNTPLWVATMNSHDQSEVVGILLMHGADPLQKNNHDVSPNDISPELFNAKT